MGSRKYRLLGAGSAVRTPTLMQTELNEKDEENGKDGYNMLPLLFA